MVNDKNYYYDLLLPNTSPFDEYDYKNHTLGNLSPINLFIGPNNSGKSRFLRHLFAQKGFDYTTNKCNMDTFISFLKSNEAEFNNLFNFGIRSIGGVARTSFKELPLIDKEIFTGLELYQRLKEMLLGEPEDKERVKEFENFLSKDFFDSKQITLTPKEGETTVHVKIGDEKQLPIYNLGDGLQNLIILTFNIFMESDRCIFFIEEPDLCMHPGFQRIFLQVLLKFDQHQYFIPTHSNHFLDMTLDFLNISVYLYKKIVENNKSKFNIESVSNKDKNILLELGVQNSSVFLTNATIWVEGITDRLYLKAYMQKFQNEHPEFLNLKEDIHYSFVEYQGANLVHWTFESDNSENECINANFVCGKSFLIADGDIAKKGNRIEIFEIALGNNFMVLDCKEIENLIPLNVLKKIIENDVEKLNKKVDELKYEEYSKSEKGLGFYIDNKLSIDKFSTESGTVKNKVDFCKKAISIMTNSEIE